MLWFSDRKKLENKYMEWLNKDKRIKDSNFNLICFLVSKDLLNEKKVKEYLEKTYKNKRGGIRLRKNYKLPKWIREIVEAELQHYYGNMKLLNTEKYEIIEESSSPPDGQPKGNGIGKPTEGKVLRMNSRKYLLVENRLDAITRVKENLNKDDRNLFDLIYKDGFNAIMAETDKGISRDIFYGVKRKIQYLTAFELGYI